MNRSVECGTADRGRVQVASRREHATESEQAANRPRVRRDAHVPHGAAKRARAGDEGPELHLACARTEGDHAVEDLEHASQARNERARLGCRRVATCCEEVLPEVRVVHELVEAVDRVRVVPNRRTHAPDEPHALHLIKEVEQELRVRTKPVVVLQEQVPRLGGCERAVAVAWADAGREQVGCQVHKRLRHVSEFVDGHTRTLHANAGRLRGCCLLCFPLGHDLLEERVDVEWLVQWANHGRCRWRRGRGARRGYARRVVASRRHWRRWTWHDWVRWRGPHRIVVGGCHVGGGCSSACSSRTSSSRAVGVDVNR